MPTDISTNWNAGDDQFGDGGINWSRLLGTTASGAAVGTTAGGAGYGTLIGAGVGLLGGLGMEAGIGGGGPSKKQIYDQLMLQHYGSPEYKAAQEALGKLKDQTVQGPTAQERNDLGQALQAANEHAAATYGNIQSQLASTQGIGASTQAALTASQGQGAASQMSRTAMQAAAGESVRRERATQAYTAATAQASQMQDDYRKWASGQANEQNDKTTSANYGNLNAAMSAGGSIASEFNQPKSGASSNSNSSFTPSNNPLSSGSNSLGSIQNPMGNDSMKLPDLTLSGQSAQSPLKNFMGASELQGAAGAATQSQQLPQQQFSDPQFSDPSGQQRRPPLSPWGSF